MVRTTCPPVSGWACPFSARQSGCCGVPSQRFPARSSSAARKAFHSLEWILPPGYRFAFSGDIGITRFQSADLHRKPAVASNLPNSLRRGAASADTMCQAIPFATSSTRNSCQAHSGRNCLRDIGASPSRYPQPPKSVGRLPCESWDTFAVTYCSVVAVAKMVWTHLMLFSLHFLLSIYSRYPLQRAWFCPLKSVGVSHGSAGVGHLPREISQLLHCLHSPFPPSIFLGVDCRGFRLCVAQNGHDGVFPDAQFY